MTNKKITDLVELTTPTTDDVFPLVDIATNSTKKAQLANLPISTATQTAINAKQDTLVSGTNIKTINSTSLLGSGNIDLVTNPAGTAGQIQFSDGSAFAADSNLYWDNTNKRLGVGTSTPTHQFTNAGLSKLQGIALGNVTHSNVNSNEICAYNSMYIFNRDIGGSVVRAITISNTGAMISADGSSTSSAMAHIKGSGSTSATTSLLVQNSSGTELLKVADDGKCTFVGNGHDLNTDSMRLQSQNALGTYMNLSSSTGYINCQQFRFFNTAVAVGTSATPGASVVLQVDSTSKGFLPPRMTTTQKNAISTPAAGLMVYDTDTNKLCCYNGTTWNDLF